MNEFYTCNNMMILVAKLGREKVARGTRPNKNHVEFILSGS